MGLADPQSPNAAAEVFETHEVTQITIVIKGELARFQPKPFALGARTRPPAAVNCSGKPATVPAPFSLDTIKRQSGLMGE